MNAQQVNDEIKSLIDRWCERRELKALATLLPAWLANNGLTDGWADLASALGTVSCHQNLPIDEREQTKRL